jgi:hypothetical protein
MERVALSYVNRYLTNFINKVLDKYKIRNYLYYGRVLDSYYLTNFIADKIDDPDLRNAYQILQAQLVTIKINPVPGQAEVAQKLLKQFKNQTDSIAQSNGLVSASLFTNPPTNLTDEQKFQAAGLYYLNNSEFVANDLRAEFVAMQAQTQAAANQEIDAGNGLKSSRGSTNSTGAAVPTGDSAAGTVGAIRSVIENPAAFAQEFTSSAISQLFEGNYDKSSPWAAMGAAIGNFIFRKLTLDNSSGVLAEYPISYTPGAAYPDPGTQIDTDSDGIPEGEDNDADGALNTPGVDICYQGGTPGTGSGCNTSSTVGSSVYFTPYCQSLKRSIAATTDWLTFVNNNADLVTGDNFKNKYDASVFARRAVEVTAAIDDLINAMENYRDAAFDDDIFQLGRYSGFMSDVSSSLIKDGDLDLARFGNGGGGIDNLRNNTANVLNYLNGMSAKCTDSNPNANVPPPVIVLPPDPENDESCQVSGALRGNDDGAPTTAPDPGSVVFEQGDGVGGWAQTSTLSSVSTSTTTIYMPYDKTNSWPGVDIGGGAIAVANPWILVWRGGAWHATTFSWFRPGQTDKDIGDVFCGGLGGAVTLGDFEPQAGETYGFMVSGIARNMGLNNIKERTNIVMYKWPSGIPRPEGTGSVPGSDLDFANHTDVVEAVKNELTANGVDLSGCGAFEIVKRVAWQLRDEGAGLLSKPDGYNCGGFASDIIAYPSGFIFDILGGGGETNNPQWLKQGEVDPSRYVAPTNPG